MLKSNNFEVYTALKSINNELYKWHPLSSYVSEVISAYNMDLNINHLDNFNSTFQEKLDYICKNNISYSYLKFIFKPLDIINYCDENNNAFYLFKYKNYIELNEMGYNLSTFFELYNGLYKECRSVVFDQYGRLILASLSKFKNYGEDNEEWSTISCKEKYINSSFCYITDKMDGSYVQFTYDDFYNKIIGSTSKNLTPHSGDSGWRLKFAYEMLDENYKTMIMNKQDYTFHFEFIHPDNPIVVYYPPEVKGLYLISARNKITGEEINFSRLLDIAKYFNVKIVKYYKYENLVSILSQVDQYNCNEKEGWVVNCIDKNKKSFRFKIKTDDYVLMHKTLSKNASPNFIVSILLQNKWDDFYSKIPEAYKRKILEISSEIISYKQKIQKVINYYYNEINLLPYYDNKKEVMLYIQKNVPDCVKGYVISAYLNKKYNILGKGKNNQSVKKYNELKKLALECEKILEKVYKE